MSLASWLFSSRRSSRADPPVAVNQRKEGVATGVEAARRKSERAARRELLYSVVREAMVRAGVLTSSYKFKVLSLDGGGRQYLVMVDLARGVGGDADQLGEIEALIVQSARARHEILVTAVYWRTSEHAAVGSPAKRRPTSGGDSRPMPLESQPAPLDSAPAPLVAPTARKSAYEPILADEVEAFKRALVAGSTGPMPLEPEAPALAKRPPEANGPRNYTLLTGYEDTELPEEKSAPLLSVTQYGDLR